MSKKDLPNNPDADPWERLRHFTPARIGLGHSGVSLRTSHQLQFQLAHAAARTAVHSSLDVEALTQAVRAQYQPPLAQSPLVVESCAQTREVYLKRPDFGRRLCEASAALVDAARTEEAPDVAIILADGLSATAVQTSAPQFLARLLPALAAAGYRQSIPIVALQGRVAIGDDIGERLGARLTFMLIGERPGLSSADSLSMYLTYTPKRGLTDASRNCISNIRDGGLSFAEAAHRTMYLVEQAFAAGQSGVALKDMSSGTLLTAEEDASSS